MTGLRKTVSQSDYYLATLILSLYLYWLHDSSVLACCTVALAFFSVVVGVPTTGICQILRRRIPPLQQKAQFRIINLLLRQALLLGVLSCIFMIVCLAVFVHYFLLDCLSFGEAPSKVVDRFISWMVAPLLLKHMADIIKSLHISVGLGAEVQLAKSVNFAIFLVYSAAIMASISDGVIALSTPLLVYLTSDLLIMVVLYLTRLGAEYKNYSMPLFKKFSAFLRLYFNGSFLILVDWMVYESILVFLILSIPRQISIKNGVISNSIFDKISIYGVFRSMNLLSAQIVLSFQNYPSILIKKKLGRRNF